MATISCRCGHVTLTSCSEAPLVPLRVHASIAPPPPPPPDAFAETPAPRGRDGETRSGPPRARVLTEDTRRLSPTLASAARDASSKGAARTAPPRPTPRRRKPSSGASSAWRTRCRCRRTRARRRRRRQSSSRTASTVTRSTRAPGSWPRTRATSRRPRRRPCLPRPRSSRACDARARNSQRHTYTRTCAKRGAARSYGQGPNTRNHMLRDVQSIVVSSSRRSRPGSRRRAARRRSGSRAPGRGPGRAPSRRPRCRRGSWRGPCI